MGIILIQVLSGMIMLTLTRTSFSDATPLDISGYTIYQEDYGGGYEYYYTFQGGTTISPEGYVIIARDATKQEFEFFWVITLASNVVFINSGNSFPILNGDEFYELRDASDVRIDGPTISMDTNAGESVQRSNTTGDAGDPTNWDVFSDSLATPGNISSPTGLGGLVISEFSDASGTGNWKYEFVELYYDVKASTPVGGISTPVNKLELLAPYIGLTILLAVVVTTVVCVKKRKRKTEIDS